MIPNINYGLIQKAVDHYVWKGYKYLEVPWIIPKSTIEITKPTECRHFDTFLGGLVGSGEQSFLEIRDELCPGRSYQCVTPCFRDDDLDQHHFNWFMKNELIIPLWKTDNAKDYLDRMISDVFSFLRAHSPSAITRKETEEGTDLLLCDVEIGSYGIRQNCGFRWVYGTGLAEPRFSQQCEVAKKLLEKESEDLLK